MAVDGEVARKLGSFEDCLHEAIRDACSRLQSDIQRSLADVARLETRIRDLQKDKRDLEAEIEANRVQSEAREREHEKVRAAHMSMRDKARRMRSWIVEVERRLPVDLQAGFDKTLLSRSPSFDSKDVSGSGGAEANVARTNAPVVEDVNSNRPADNGLANPASDPATESTQTASSPPSQDTPRTRRRADSDSDVPQVVSERTLKRKRSPRRQPYIKPEPLTPEAPPLEPSTLDLDEISLPLATADSDDDPAALPNPCEVHRILPQSTSTFEPQQVGMPAPGMGSSRAKPAGRPADPSFRKERCDPHVPIYQDLKAEDAPRPPKFLALNASSALQPKSPNHVVRTPKRAKPALPKSQRWHRDEGIAMFGEDETENNEENPQEATNSSNMLEQLLYPPASETKPLAPLRPRATPRLHSTGRLNSLRNGRSAASLPKTPTPNPQTRPTAEPRTTARSRRPEDFTLDDFKLNPARNDGMNFAFNEVVRKKDQRRCLPGCTKPDCCGDKFSRVVQIAGYTPTRSRLSETLRGSAHGNQQVSPRDNVRSSARGESSALASDEQMLRNFLGSAADRLEFMSAAEKEDLLVKAKARAFGQTYGRHRNMHARPPSPPGFWRTDMPSTQEFEMDGQAATALERKEVQERLHEALQPNGKWMFRDDRSRTD